MRLRPLQGLLCSLLLCVPSSKLMAATPTTQQMQEHVWLTRISARLDSVKSFRARFKQINPDGTLVTGTVWLQKPGRMRFDYDKPSPLLLVVNDGKIVYQDRDLGQVTEMPLDRSPLSILLRQPADLLRDVSVRRFALLDDRIHLTVVQSQNPSAGQLELDFDTRNMELVSWTIHDAAGKETRVVLTDVLSGISIKPSLFTLPNLNP